MEPLRQIEDGLRKGQHHLHPEIFSEEVRKKLLLLKLRSMEAFIAAAQVDDVAVSHYLGLTAEELEHLAAEAFAILPEESQLRLMDSHPHYYISGAIPPPEE